MRFFHARASIRARWNAMRTLEVNGVPLVAHNDKVVTLTGNYSNILGGEVATS